MDKDEVGSDLGKSDSEHVSQSDEENEQYDSEPIGSSYDSKEMSKGRIMILKENSESKKKKKKNHNVERRITHKETKRKATITKFNAVEHENSEDEEEEKKNFRQIVDKFFSIGHRLNILQIITSGVSLLSFIFYVICTYKTSLFKIMNYLDFLIIGCYFVEYMVHFILAHHRLAYVLTLDSLINLFTMVPGIFGFITKDYMTSGIYMFINTSRVFRFLRIPRIINIFKNNEENNVNKQVTMIIITLLNIIFIFAGAIQIIEYNEVEKSIKIQNDELSLLALHMRTKFHHYLYFTVVTASTVGYGDIYPLTPIGKMYFMAFVLLVIVVIPYQINDLITIMSSQSEYSRYTYKASKDIPHIILTGDISLDSLRSFCQEFFHPDHGGQYRHAVILNSIIPNREMEIFLHEKTYENFIFYLQGDGLNEKDLLRADVPRAKACIIFNNKNSKDPHSGDHQSLFLGIFIKKFVYTYNNDQLKNATNLNQLLLSTNTSFHLCMQLNKPESSAHFYNTLQPMYKKHMKQDQLIVIESIKMNLLSKSCLTPGIMALITNLVMSSGEFSDSNGESEWMKEYAEGRGHEIYRIQLQAYYQSLTFIEVVENVYNQAQAIVFALEIEIGGVSILKLNPFNCNGMKIMEFIEKAKDLNNSDKTKESRSKINDISEQYSDVDKEKFNYPKNFGDNKIRIFVYLICSDKEVADEIANKEKETSLIRKPTFTKDKKEQALTNILSSIPSMVQNLMGGKNSTNVIEVNNQNTKKNDYNNQSMGNPLGASNNNYVNSDSSSESEDEDDKDSIIQFSSSDMDFNRNDYYFNDSPEHYLRNNIEIMHHSIKDREDISNHIIICGLHPALVHFILPLRAKYLQEDALKWIVILAPSLPQHLFEAFTKFSRIIFIQGSPLLPENLFRANILNADKAVILSSGQSKAIKQISLNQIHDSTYNFYSEEQMLDAETIFIYKAIKKCNKNIQIMTELICTNNIEYLLSTSNLQQLFYKQDGQSPQYEFTPLYASGEVFTPSIIDRLTCQSYYNPHIVTILNLLLSGERANRSIKIKKLDEFYSLGNSNLYLVKIPDAHVNESYGEFFYFLLRHHSIGIALYRKNIIEGFYYVYTNPKKTTLLRDSDFVFVLSNNVNILDLVDERLIINDANDLSQNNDSNSSDSVVEDGIQDQNGREKTKIVNQDNNNISNRKRNTKKLDSNAMDKYARNDLFINSIAKLEQKKNNESTKNAQIERIQQRIENIKNDLLNIKDGFVNLPSFIDKIIDKEVDSEMMVYLTKS